MAPQIPPAPLPAPIPLRDIPTSLREVPLAALDGNPRNVRRWAADDDAKLKTSLAQQGLLQPLLVSPRGDDPTRFLVHDGNRRLAALRAFGVAAAQVKVFEAVLTPLQEDILISTQEFTKHRLPVAEMAVLLRRMVAGGEFPTVDAAAQFVGLTGPTASKLLKVNDRLVPDLRDGPLPISVKLELAGTDDPAVQRELAGLYDRGLLTRDSLAVEVRRRSRAANPARKPKAVKAGFGKSAATLVGTPAEVRVELEALLKAVSKAESLGLGLTAVPDLIKGGTK